MNSILTKPVNPYFFSTASDIRGSIIPFTVLFFITVLIMIILNNTYSNYLLAIAITLIGFIMQVIF